MKDEGEDLGVRTKRFALSVIRFYASLPRSPEAQVTGKQLLRSGTSVGANYAEGHRARSKAEVVSKFETALQELEETRYWLALMIEGGISTPDTAQVIDREADELIRILVTCVKRVKAQTSGKRS